MNNGKNILIDDVHAPVEQTVSVCWSVTLAFMGFLPLQLLVADMQLYNLLCWSLGIGRSVGYKYF